MAEQNYQKIRHTDQLIFNEDGDLIGIQNPKGHGEDFLPVRLSADGTSLVSGDGTSFLYGPATSGTWMKPPSIFRLRITGTGTLQMDSKDSLGNITLLTFPLTTYTGETDKIEFPYAGDDAVAIRVTLTGTLTCEVI